MATEADKINAGALATLVAVSAISLVGITLAVTALARDQMSLEEAAKESRAGAEYEKLRGEQLEKLRSGTPIEEAMRKVVADLARDPRSATPMAAPAASPSAGAAPSVPGSAAPAASAGPTGALVPTSTPGIEAKPGTKAQKAAPAPLKAAAPAPSAEARPSAPPPSAP